MRIITGKARGTKLFSLEGEETRPTSDRTKEAIFSILQFSIEGRKVLDLFGGSGQMALEAVSRGAESAVIADRSKAAVGIIEKNCEKTHLGGSCKVMCSDWGETLRRLKGNKFDIVFLDPPYALNIIPKILTELNNYLKPTSVVVCESGNDISEDIGDAYSVIKQAKYGVAYVTLLKLKGE